VGCGIGASRFGEKAPVVRHFILDTDTASDDAVAIVMALQYLDLQVGAITAVAGNVFLERGIRLLIGNGKRAIRVHVIGMETGS
jgi:inosine-uridine nucleoside N-ribohydrolase